jgi:hypothetical protein
MVYHGHCRDCDARIPVDQTLCRSCVWAAETSINAPQIALFEPDVTDAYAEVVAEMEQDVALVNS